MSHVDPLPRIDVPPRPRSTDPLIAAWLGAAATGMLKPMQEALASSDARSSLESSSDGFGTALHWAVSRDQLKVTDFLLQLGVDVNARTSRGGFTALHIAAHFGHHEVAAMLLGAGATPSARSQSGTTPLHHAVVSSDVRTASQLLAHGASVATPSDASRPKATHPPAVAARVSATATGVPKQKAAREVLVLLEKEEKMLSAWTRAARRRLYDEVDRLLSCRARVDACVSNHGESALMLAAGAGRVDLVMLLLSHGASARLTDDRRRSALHHAAARLGDTRILASLVKMLLDAGGLADARDEGGNTPWHLADASLIQDGHVPQGMANGLKVANQSVVVLLRRALDQRNRMRRWRVIGRLAGRLHTLHVRAAERAYAPGGLGANLAALDWEARVVGSKRSRAELEQEDE